MSTILALFNKPATPKVVVTETRKCGRSSQERDSLNGRFPQEPAKASYADRLARLNKEAVAKARAERRAAKKLLATRKQVLEILRFGGKTIFSLSQEVLSNALVTAKQAGHIAFVRVVQEYALGCLEAGLQFDVNCESWIARQAHKVALAAERQALKETLREVLRNHFEAAGIKVHASHTQVVVNESVKSREVAAQSVKKRGRYAHLQAACPRYDGSTTAILYSVEKAIAEADDNIVEVQKDEPAVEDTKTSTNEDSLVVYSRMLNRAGEVSESLPLGKEGNADAIRKEKAEAVVKYYRELVSIAIKSRKGKLTSTEVKAAKVTAASTLKATVAECKAKLAAFRKGRKSASTAKSESKKGKSKSNK